MIFITCRFTRMPLWQGERQNAITRAMKKFWEVTRKNGFIRKRRGCRSESYLYIWVREKHIYEVYIIYTFFVYFNKIIRSTNVWNVRVRKNYLIIILVRTVRYFFLYWVDNFFNYSLEPCAIFFYIVDNILCFASYAFCNFFPIPTLLS